jgi:hypothetical protein
VKEVQPGRITSERGVEVHRRRLLLGLERARTHLAVAAARERRATPLPKWGIYRETEDRMRHCLRRLRADGSARQEVAETWLPALDALDHLLGPVAQVSQSGEAERLNRRLAEILEILEALTS